MNIDLNGIENWAIQILQEHYLDILPILVGTLAALCFTIIIEGFIPITWSVKIQQSATRLLTVGISWPLCTILWGTLDPVDSRLTRSIWSLASSVISVFAYKYFARWATKKFPWFASIWAVT